jgi:hypothetical protein
MVLNDIGSKPGLKWLWPISRFYLTLWWRDWGISQRQSTMFSVLMKNETDILLYPLPPEPGCVVADVSCFALRTDNAENTQL